MTPSTPPRNDPTATTMELDRSVAPRDADDHAIESLASSIMEDTTEATTETFYVGEPKDDPDSRQMSEVIMSRSAILAANVVFLGTL